MSKEAKSINQIDLEREIMEQKRIERFHKEGAERERAARVPEGVKLLMYCAAIAAPFVISAAISKLDKVSGDPLGIMIKEPTEKIIFSTEINRNKCPENKGVTIKTGPLFDGEGKLLPKPETEIYYNPKTKNE